MPACGRCCLIQQCASDPGRESAGHRQHPEEFANQIKAEYAVYRKVVQTQTVPGLIARPTTPLPRKKRHTMNPSRYPESGDALYDALTQCTTIAPLTTQYPDHATSTMLYAIQQHMLARRLSAGEKVVGRRSA